MSTTPTWQKAEDDGMGLDVRRVGGSGCGWVKGDQVGADTMVEVKTTSSAAWRVSTDVVRKLRRQAMSAGLTPILRVTMQADGPDPETVAVLPWDVFMLLYEVASSDAG